MSTEAQTGATQSTDLVDTHKAREMGLTQEDLDQAAADLDQEEAPRHCLTEEEIWDAPEPTHLDNWVPTPEWGAAGAGMYVRPPTSDDRERYEKMTKPSYQRRGRRRVQVKEMDFDELRERLMVDFAVDEAGDPVFKCATKKQRREKIERLKRKSAAPIARVADLVCELMGWTQDDIDEMVKN